MFPVQVPTTKQLKYSYVVLGSLLGARTLRSGLLALLDLLGGRY